MSVRGARQSLLYIESKGRYTDRKPVAKNKKSNPPAALRRQLHAEKPVGKSASTPSAPLRGFPIVGIGASAGGLEAFKQLLAHLPIDTGMSFVLIQHLDPKHESLSAEIFSRATRMKVTEVKDGVRVEPNQVYIIPPGFSMGLLNGVLNLMPRTEVRGQHFVVDSFFQSLADEQRNRAIGIVLSGTASDGTEGLLAIKAAGGITMVQDPKSAKFDGMPQSAINSGAVDLVLGAQQIAEELVRIAHHPYVRPALAEVEEAPTDELPPEASESLSQIFLSLRNQSHVDFSLYKPTTIRRRIERRMVLHKVDDLSSYATMLAHNPGEVKALYADILINVTSFFRDPEAFKVLKTEVFPKIVEGRPPGLSIRIWSPGCSSGEETYSLAISLLEFLGEKASTTPIQIFASDISDQAIQKARTGEYSEAIRREVSQERLNRFFTKTEGGNYKIAKSIRDMCLFSRHDVTVDPPFPKMDLIVCRNLLIYFSAPLQKRVIPVFHYALSPRGFLWLGKSESIAGFGEHFSVIDKTNKVYAKKSAPIALNLNFPSRTYTPGGQGLTQPPRPFHKAAVDVQKLTDKGLEEEYPGVLVNEGMEILQFRGSLAGFIIPASGAPSTHLFKMVRPEILPFLRIAIQLARKRKASVRKDGLSFREGRSVRTFNLKVMPLKRPSGSKEQYYFIHFEDVTESMGREPKQPKGRKKDSAHVRRNDPYLAELQQELASNQEYQQALVERSDAAQEDLKASNEELQSANEELQSTNEELETAKEELQSGNEELSTVNDELQSRSLEQAQTNNDLVNLLGSVQIAIVMLGSDRRIRRFTPLAGKALNLISSDIGRPITDLKFHFTSPGADLDLEHMATTAIETMESQELEVLDRQGRWFRLQVRPYKTIDGKIDGAVLSLVDIDVLKQSLKEVKAARAEAEKANRAKDLFLATLSHELRTPLTAILSWAQLLQSGKLDSEKILRAGKTIEECGKTQAELINDLLDVSRIILGKLPLELSEVDPSDIIAKAVESVRPTAEKKSIKIETHFHPWAGSIVGDPLRLQQVFWNLLNNAIKFSSPNSKVIVRLEKAKDERGGERAKAQIKVIDSGKGISAEFLPHIFDSFSQEDASSIRVHGGLGLGLAIVKNLVELHGGQVIAESAGEKLGATFTVILPIKSVHPKSFAQPPSKKDSANAQSRANAEARLDGLRVLIVDDQESSRDVFTETLRSFGAETQAAESAKEALERFEVFKPHVLVSDIAMPGEDGYSLIRKVRALGAKRGGNTPSIAVTAHAGADDIKRALSAGFQAHVAKPVDSTHLASVIAKLAAKAGE